MITPLPERARLAPKEAAEYLELSERTLRNWRSAGAGPDYIKAGGRIRYVVTDLDQWLDAHRVTTTRNTPALTAVPRSA